MADDVKIIVTDCDHANLNDEAAVFKKAGIPWKLCQCHTEDDLIRECQGVVAVCNQYAKFTERVFAGLPKLKLVSRYGVGVDNIDLEAATRHGVQICNVPDYGAQYEVADHALTLMLALTRKILPANAQVHAGGWDYSKFIPIVRTSCMKVGVIGLGHVGSSYAKKVHALGCKVLGYDVRTDQVTSNPELSFVELKSFDEVLAEADVISLHCGLNEGNAAFMNASAFAKMKKGAYFVNVSRGGLVNEPDLAEALKSGHLGGAGLDVTVKEPLPADSVLKTAPNLILTPHMAWYSLQAASAVKTKCAEEAVRCVLGQPPRCPVNKLS